MRQLVASNPLLTDRPVSRRPNLVTPAGLAKIDAQLRDLEAAEREAGGDAAALAHIERDLRYWRQRRSTARVVEPPATPAAVRFGVTVRLRFHDGDERCFRIVGEDEADSQAGLVSWTSPLATTLIGRLPGDTLELFGQGASIAALSGPGEASAITS